MKAISNFIFTFLKVLLSIINALLIIIIIVNILLLLSKIVLKADYPSIMDYTYYNVNQNDNFLNIKKGDLLLIDVRTKYQEGNVVMYKTNSKYSIGKIEKDEDEVTIKDSKQEITVYKDDVEGIVIARSPLIGSILEIILTPVSMIIAIVILILTTMLQSFIKKKTKKENQTKPNFNQTW